MDILPVNFTILKFCGMWKESKSGNIVIRLLHHFYRCFVVVLIYHVTICEMIELVRIRNNIEDLTEGLFLTFTYIALCFKIGNFIVRSREIGSLLNDFRFDVCRPRNIREEEILDQYGERAKRCTLSFMVLSQITGIALIAAPIFRPRTTVVWPLPYKMYTPYATTDPLPYFLTYLDQATCQAYGIILNVCLDSLVYGFTICTCGQIELLRYRLTEVFEDDQLYRYEINFTNRNNRPLIGKCVRHHMIIQILARKIQSLFVWTVTVQFFLSLIVFCTSIFRMSKQTILSVEFWSLLLYLGSILFQIFFYCWYGNELELKSNAISQAVYFSQWINAEVPERKSLLIVMTSCQKGLKLSYHGNFALSISTFMWILKTSYSAFNLLQQMSN